MTGIVHLFDELQYRRALRRERVFRDRRNPLDMYDDIELYDRFRLPRNRLMELINELKDDLQHPTRRQMALTPEMQVLVGLRLLANGSFQNAVGDIFNIDRTTSCRVIRRVVIALKARLLLYVKFPADQKKLDIIKQGFYDMAGFPNVVGCIDGTHVPIQAPSSFEWEYVNRKGVHSINVQLMCDHTLKIINCVVRWPGSTHDARILSESAIYRHFQNDQNIGFVLGDSGYPLLPWLMTPVLAPVCNAEHRYNSAHVTTGNSIERCNGILKRRFACLNKLRMKPQRACDVIQACIVMHNICMDAVGIREDVQINPDDGADDINQHADFAGNVTRRRLIQNVFSR